MGDRLTVVASALFRKDFRRCAKRGLDLGKLRATLWLLAERRTLPPAMRDHALVGNYRGYRECHIAPDWLLVYRVEDEQLILVAFRTGSHSDLF